MVEKLSEYVISVEKGKFFRCVMSPDRRQYRKMNEREWHGLGKGCAIYRNPGMYEVEMEDSEGLEKALQRYEAEIREAKKTEMFRRVEMKFPMRDWLQGITSEHRGGKRIKCATVK